MSIKLSKETEERLLEAAFEHLGNGSRNGLSFSKGLIARMRVLGFRQGAIDELMRDEYLYLYAGEMPDDANAFLEAGAQCIIKMHPDGAGGFSGAAMSTGVATFYRWGTADFSGDSLCIQGRVGGNNEPDVLRLSRTGIMITDCINCSGLKFGFGNE